MSRVGDSPGYRSGWCVHYRSPSDGDTCDAGVNYERFRKSAPLPWPCFMDKNGKPKPDTAICWDQRPPTPEEIEAHRVWAHDRAQVWMKVMASVAPWRKRHKGEAFGEVVVCAACGGRLHLSIARSNGHVHGHCETAGCVSWME